MHPSTLPDAMRPLFGVQLLLLTACGGAPHAPPAPIESPVTASSLGTGTSPPWSSQVAVLEDPSSRLPSVPAQSDGPLRAEVMPGMERVERVSLLEAGIRCGTRLGKSPVCVAEGRTGSIAYEALQPVKKLEALGATHCSLFESGRLTCEIVDGTTGR